MGVVTGVSDDLLVAGAGAATRGLTVVGLERREYARATLHAEGSSFGPFPTLYGLLPPAAEGSEKEWVNPIKFLHVRLLSWSVAAAIPVVVHRWNGEQSVRAKYLDEHFQVLEVKRNLWSFYKQSDRSIVESEMKFLRHDRSTNRLLVFACSLTPMPYCASGSSRGFSSMQPTARCREG